jgi:hypothetical protein
MSSVSSALWRTTEENAMFTMERLIFALALVLMPVVFLAPAEATITLNHTWVSSAGNDNNSCDITAPCLTFIGAYEKTSAGGEITCQNGGDYGGLIITKSITVDCEYSIGSLLPGSGSPDDFGISPPAGSVVTLRGLDVDLGGETYSLPARRCH